MDMMGWLVLKQISVSSVENFQENLEKRLNYMKDLYVDEDGDYTTENIFADPKPNPNSNNVDACLSCTTSRTSEGNNQQHPDKKALSSLYFTCNRCQKNVPIDGYPLLVLNNVFCVCKVCIPSYVQGFLCHDIHKENSEKMVSLTNDIKFPNPHLDFSRACMDIPYHQEKYCTESEEEKYTAKCRYCNSPISLTKSVENFDSSSKSIKIIRSMLDMAHLDTSWCIKKKDFLTVHLFESSVCQKNVCRKRMSQACTKKLECGHHCGGILEEQFCLPCLEIECQGHARLQNKGELLPSGNQMCPICQNLSLRKAPSIQLQCGHVVHFHCARNRFPNSSPGPELDFLYCPCCPTIMRHYRLNSLLQSHLELLDLVKDKAVNRLKVEGLDKFDNSEHVEDYAMSYYQYYVCKICKNPYYGGKRNSANNQSHPDEFICRGCIAARTETCGVKEHGNSYIGYKCWYCCSLAINEFSNGKVICESCHSLSKKRRALPRLRECQSPKGCPLGMAHGPHKRNCCLGCMECRRLGQ